MTTSALQLDPALQSTDKRTRAQAVAKRFEQIFVQQMIQGMRKMACTDDSEGLFGKGPGAGTYEDWFDVNMANHLTGEHGIGLARSLLRSWERMGQIPPADSAGDKVAGKVGDETADSSAGKTAAALGKLLRSGGVDVTA